MGNEQKWTASEIKPTENGYYMVHIYKSYCANLDKVFLNSKEAVSNEAPEEYSTTAEYDVKLNKWLVRSSKGISVFYGRYKTIDHIEFIYQETIVEWCEIPGFKPVSAVYKAFDDDKYGFINPYISSLVKQRTKSCSSLKDCKVTVSAENGKNDFYIKLKDENQFKALLMYFTRTFTDPHSGEITYEEPENNGYEGAGTYKIGYDTANRVSYVTLL